MDFIIWYALGWVNINLEFKNKKSWNSKWISNWGSIFNKKTPIYGGMQKDNN